MNKDFINWHFFKKTLHTRKSKIVFREREIWFCSIGINIGHEEDGKNDKFERPVLIFNKMNSETFWAIPLTTKEKRGKVYFKFIFLSRGQKKHVCAILSQIKLLDKKRLQRKIGTMKKKTFTLLLEKFKKIIPKGN